MLSAIVQTRRALSSGFICVHGVVTANLLGCSGLNRQDCLCFKGLEHMGAIFRKKGRARCARVATSGASGPSYLRTHFIQLNSSCGVLKINNMPGLEAEVPMFVPPFSLLTRVCDVIARPNLLRGTFSLWCRNQSAAKCLEDPFPNPPKTPKFLLVHRGEEFAWLMKSLNYISFTENNMKEKAPCATIPQWSKHLRLNTAFFLSRGESPVLQPRFLKILQRRACATLSPLPVSFQFSRQSCDVWLCAMMISKDSHGHTRNAICEAHS